eukprot:TRINITY_DN20013_c1_g5_i1.p3 TRINITY_DN20013_c1_g5~~TRINITY_DN20013_c1_g5_i1.p3  ORF type:complete len:108 (+),score=7.49 TRINITY_DN20013_c1_g5_i1:274-597(+)
MVCQGYAAAVLAATTQGSRLTHLSPTHATRALPGPAGVVRWAVPSYQIHIKRERKREHDATTTFPKYAWVQRICAKGRYYGHPNDSHTPTSKASSVHHLCGTLAAWL